MCAPKSEVADNLGLLAAAALPASQSLTAVARLLEEAPCTDINHKLEVQHAVDL